ncbi:MAG: TfoX/Sxy family protein [Flavisolibacter sp.]
MAKKNKQESSSKKTVTPPKKSAMPAWEKSSEELIKKFYAALPEDNKVERKKLFGYPSAFVNGNMAAGMFRQHIIARLDEKERNEWVTKKGASIFEPMTGRAMKEYIVLPEEVVQQSVLLKNILQKAINYALLLKPKEKKKK